MLKLESKLRPKLMRMYMDLSENQEVWKDIKRASRCKKIKTMLTLFRFYNEFSTICVIFACNYWQS